MCQKRRYFLSARRRDGFAQNHCTFGPHKDKDIAALRTVKTDQKLAASAEEEDTREKQPSAKNSGRENKNDFVAAEQQEMRFGKKGCGLEKCGGLKNTGAGLVRVGNRDDGLS